MFVQTQNTPNPNALKFLPGKKVCNIDPFEITDKNMSDNELVRNILSNPQNRITIIYPHKIRQPGD